MEYHILWEKGCIPDQQCIINQASVEEHWIFLLVWCQGRVIPSKTSPSE
jgi:hypothetical protein